MIVAVSLSKRGYRVLINSRRKSAPFARAMSSTSIWVYIFSGRVHQRMAATALIHLGALFKTVFFYLRKAMQRRRSGKYVLKNPRCCRIRYHNGFHIDLPAYHLDSNRDARTLAAANGWETSDPKAIYVWFRDQFEDSVRDKLRRQVRYFKTWAALKFKDVSRRPSSILLTVLVVEAALSLGTSNIGVDDEVLGDLANEIIARLTKARNVPCPVNVAEELNRLSEQDFDTFIDQLKKLQDVASRANMVEDEFEAADIWQEAFEHMFPMPDPEDTLAKDSQNLPVLQFMPEIKVIATSRTNPNARPFSGTNSIGPIPKNCGITFEVTNTAALPIGATIQWTVRNEGREAELVNDLGHSASIGSIATERSEYKGTHYMDCVVRVAGRTIAIRRVPVIITGLSMPLRNPPRKIRPY